MFGKHANLKNAERAKRKKCILSGERHTKICLDLCVNNAQQIKLSVISIAYIMGRNAILYSGFYCIVIEFSCDLFCQPA